MRLGPLAAVACLAAALPAMAQVERFDIQHFRPTAAPQDLVLVGQSRPLAHLSAATGFYFNYALDPLVLVPIGGERETTSVVKNRLQLDLVATVGLFDVLELGVSAPIVLAQASDNLEAIGTEGNVRSFATGDIRLSAKVALPYLRRPAARSGFGAAITFGVGLPTGVPEAFAGDGLLTTSPGFILDYRFENGVLLALNAGAWLRPQRELAGAVLSGDLVSLGLAAEIPIVRRWGITAVGGVAGVGSLEELASVGSGQSRFPAEALVGLRWYGSNGVTMTLGGGSGCGCGLGAPSFRFFSSMLWVPGKTREREAIERFKSPPVDRDGDGVIGAQDRCPEVAGPVANFGCPDQDGDGVLGEQDQCPDQAGPIENRGCPEADRDGDGVIDRLDQCPDDHATERGKAGCPLARIQGDKIVILEQVNFATGQDVILPESFPTLQDVARILEEHPEFERILIEGHTDIRNGDAYNMDLSNRRAASVRKHLIKEGIDPKRLRSEGFGRHRPIAPNTTEAGMALNRRVEFTIERIATPKATQGQEQLQIQKRKK